MPDRTPGSSPLPVRLSGHQIGELHPNGTFVWSEGWPLIAPLNTPALSHSLPFGAERMDPAPFFGGLLPEGIGLERLSRELRVASNNLYGLLSEVGADVGGSVTVGEPRPPVDPIPIDASDFDHILATAVGYLRGSSVGGGGSSATGVQPKISLTFDPSDGRWMIGRGSTPSTHLLKPALEEHSATLHAEAYLNLIARRLGLASHSSRVEPAGARRVLVIERYDRAISDDGTISRLHQEDAAQALALPWGGNDKYESVNPRASLTNIARTLDRGRSVFSTEPPDQERLLAICVLNVIAGNTDAHAKNFSLMLPPLPGGGASPAGHAARARLADAYDIVPQELFTAEADPLAMRINGQRIAGAVRAEDLIAEGRSWGLQTAAATVERTLMAITEAVSGTECEGAPALPSYLLERAHNLLRGDQTWTRKMPPALVRWG